MKMKSRRLLVCLESEWAVWLHAVGLAVGRERDSGRLQPILKCMKKKKEKKIH